MKWLKYNAYWLLILSNAVKIKNVIIIGYTREKKDNNGILQLINWTLSNVAITKKKKKEIVKQRHKWTIYWEI